MWSTGVAQNRPRQEEGAVERRAAGDDGGGHGALVAALRDCSAQAQSLSDALSRRLFSHVGPADRAVWQ